MRLPTHFTYLGAHAQLQAECRHREMQQGCTAPIATDKAPGEENLGLLLLAMIVAIERKRQGWDKAEFGKHSGLERQRRDQDKRSKAVCDSAFSPPCRSR